jgi:hypothetical protein
MKSENGRFQMHVKVKYLVIVICCKEEELKTSTRNPKPSELLSSSYCTGCTLQESEDT